MDKNFENLLFIERSYKFNEFDKNNKTDKEYKKRLTRLIMGYYATQFFFRRIVNKKLKIADVGCYYGQWSYPLLSLSKEVNFIDISNKHFDYLKKLTNKIYNSNFIVHDFSKKKLNKKFDLIICLDTIHYIDANHLEDFLINLLDSLDNNGYLLVDVRDAEKIFLYTHFILQTKYFLHINQSYLAGSFDSNMPLKPKMFSFLHTFYLFIRYYIRYYVKKILSIEILGVIHTPKRNKTDITNKVLKNHKLNKIDISEYINLSEEYEICRDIEGYNLRNTFVKNYLSIVLYQKKTK
jgi:2-polyprenyl-3-methyl-5-hydroxy-6-metoxy-1,4-benzoquinol methylase